jgi:CspA family cold shock protein
MHAGGRTFVLMMGFALLAALLLLADFVVVGAQSPPIDPDEYPGPTVSRRRRRSVGDDDHLLVGLGPVGRRHRRSPSYLESPGPYAWRRRRSPQDGENAGALGPVGRRQRRSPQDYGYGGYNYGGNYGGGGYGGGGWSTNPYPGGDSGGFVGWSDNWGGGSAGAGMGKR